MEESANYINDVLRGTSAPFECILSSTKGRTLRMTREASPGEILFSGLPLHTVSEDLQNPVYIELMRLFKVVRSHESLDYDAMWFWCGLCSLSYEISEYLVPIALDQSKQLHMLYHPEVISASKTTRLIADITSPLLLRALTDSDLLEIETMTVIWTLNCFEHSEDPLTYATYFLPSFMSHSCSPSAMWTTSGDLFEIRAQTELFPSQELTVSYLTEEFCLRPIDKRRAHLESTKFFVCDCSRCSAPSDDTRGFALPRHFSCHQDENSSNSESCFVRYPQWDICVAHGYTIALPDDAFISVEELLLTESHLSQLVNTYDAEFTKDDILPTRTNPDAIPSDKEADHLEDLIDRIGPYHWASMRGLFQLAMYHKHYARFPKAIQLMERYIACKRKYVRFSAPEVSSSFAWALEELGDILLLHVSGSIRAGVSEASRDAYCEKWSPKSSEDREAMQSLKIKEAYQESADILDTVFGPQHENRVTALEKLNRVRKLLDDGRNAGDSVDRH